MSVSETGPVYGVPLIQTLPPGTNGGMMQQMPSRADLSDVRRINERVSAGYEVLLDHYRKQCFEIAELKSKLARAK